MSDRPIKYNPTGKYNLNFIDWQNEWENIAQAEYDGENPPEKSPIYGMSPSQFHKLILADSISFELEQDDLQKQFLGMGKKMEQVKKMKVGKTDKDCSICLKAFVKGEVIRLLKCKHIFHDQCIVPWLESHTVCPNCRKNLKEEQ